MLELSGHKKMAENAWCRWFKKSHEIKGVYDRSVVAHNNAYHANGSDGPSSPRHFFGDISLNYGNSVKCETTFDECLTRSIKRSTLQDSIKVYNDFYTNILALILFLNAPFRCCWIARNKGVPDQRWTTIFPTCQGYSDQIIPLSNWPDLCEFDGPFCLPKLNPVCQSCANLTLL